MANFRIYNETLCPEMWDTAQHLDPTVRANLLEMAKDFYEKTNLPAPIIDIYLMGSIANYNWTVDSDTDVHVIINYSQLQMPSETANKTVKTAGAQWNAEHNITVKGHKVEMNIQNAEEQKPYVTGIYSLIKDQWVRKPLKMVPQINKSILRIQYNAMKNYVLNALNTGDREQMKAAKKYLDAYRQYGLDTYGELSYENLVFKILRARGIIKQLKDSITTVYDQEMTIPEGSDLRLSNLMYTVPEKKNYIVLGISFPGGDVVSGITLGTQGHVHIQLTPSQEQQYQGTPRPQHWRYRSVNNTLYMPHEQYGEEDIRQILGHLKKRYDIVPKDISTDFSSYLSKGHSVNEIGTRNIGQTLPSIGPQFDRDYQDKFDKEKHEFRLDRLTMDELKALREKEIRAVTYCQQHESPAYEALHRRMYSRYDNELKRRLAQINAPITESPLMTKKGITALAGDEPLKGQSVEKVMGNIVVLRQGKEGGFVAVGWTMVYFMDSDESAQAMKKGEIPYLVVPRGTFMGGGSPVTDIWKKKFQKPGTEHILGVIEGHSDDKNIFIDMITVRPGWKRNHIAKLMMDRLKKTFPDAKLTTSTQTDAGQKLFKSYGGEQQKTNEGYGSGIPEKDRLKIKNTDGSTRRWQIRSKNAPKTPKMTSEIVPAIPKADFEEGQPLPPMK